MERSFANATLWFLESDQLADALSVPPALTRLPSSPAFRLVGLLTLAMIFCATCRATTYYVNCNNSTNGSGTSASPWNTLASANAHTFAAGDSLLFYTPATCTGNFTANGSGTSSYPITVNEYGPGPGLPVIAGAGYTDTIDLINVQYWSINKLEITNMSHDWPNAHRGINIDADNFGTMSGISVIGCYIHDVYGNDQKDEDGSSGIQLSVDGTTTQSLLNNIVIENNTIAMVWRSGIESGSSWKGDRPSGYTDSWPTGWTNIVIEGNRLSSIAGDGIVAEHMLGPVIQNNILRGSAHYTNN